MTLSLAPSLKHPCRTESGPCAGKHAHMPWSWRGNRSSKAAMPLLPWRWIQQMERHKAQVSPDKHCNTYLYLARGVC